MKDNEIRWFTISLSLREVKLLLQQLPYAKSSVSQIQHESGETKSIANCIDYLTQELKEEFPEAI